MEVLSLDIIPVVYLSRKQCMARVVLRDWGTVSIMFLGGYIVDALSSYLT